MVLKLDLAVSVSEVNTINKVECYEKKSTDNFLNYNSSLRITGFARTGLADYPRSVQEEDVKGAYQPPSYSPYAGRNFPAQVYRGDTHVHTDNSPDARGLGAKLDVENALRFACGEEVVSSHGLPFKLSRPEILPAGCSRRTISPPGSYSSTLS